MAFKFVVLAALVAVANAGLIGAPLGYAAAPAQLSYAAAPAHVSYAAGPAHVSYAAGPAHVSYAAAPAQLSYAAAAPAHLAYATAPVAVAKAVDSEYDPHPQYSYAYDVQDGLTGDSKSQHESRDGDVVQGSYSLLESDGTRRTVDYTADPVNGFNAVVHKEPAQVAVKAVHAAPVVHAHYAAPAVKVAAPLSYAAHSYYH